MHSVESPVRATVSEAYLRLVDVEDVQGWARCECDWGD